MTGGVTMERACATARVCGAGRQAFAAVGFASPGERDAEVTWYGHDPAALRELASTAVAAAAELDDSARGSKRRASAKPRKVSSPFRVNIGFHRALTSDFRDAVFWRSESRAILLLLWDGPRCSYGEPNLVVRYDDPAPLLRLAGDAEAAACELENELGGAA